MKIGIASDHRGYDLKQELIKYLKNKNYEITDYGTNSIENVDYTKYGFLLGEKVASHEVDYGIAICGSGIGISIACNKVKGIRCAKVSSVEDAYLTRKDNDANIIALSGKLSKFKAKNIVNTFFKTEFSNTDRYISRIKQISDYENK